MHALIFPITNRCGFDQLRSGDQEKGERTNFWYGQNETNRNSNRKYSNFFKRIRHERCLSVLTKCKYSNTHTESDRKRASERERMCWYKRWYGRSARIIFVDVEKGFCVAYHKFALGVNKKHTLLFVSWWDGNRKMHQIGVIKIDYRKIVKWFFFSKNHRWNNLVFWRLKPLVHRIVS